MMMPYFYSQGKGRDEEFNIECNEKTNPQCQYVKPVGYALIVGIFPMLLVSIVRSTKHRLRASIARRTSSKCFV